MFWSMLLEWSKADKTKARLQGSLLMIAGFLLLALAVIGVAHNHSRSQGWRSIVADGDALRLGPVTSREYCEREGRSALLSAQDVTLAVVLCVSDDEVYRVK
jgi:hypothetical protein